MLRKLLACALALTGLLIGLGAFGHSFGGRKVLDAGLAPLPLDAHTDKLIYLVWYFCGGCMLAFGALVIWSAWKVLHGERSALFASGLVGAFYLVTGVLALDYMREPFWGAFVILGGLALVLSGLLGLAPPARTASRIDQPAA
jgi:hypothetical protein